MTFPTTRYTLIQRIATNSIEADWTVFLTDYWRPICRFAARWGKLSLHDAEDVASVTLETMIRNDLLVRWTQDPRARLRTLICAVVRKVLANNGRRQRTEQRHLREYVIEFGVQCRFEELILESIPGGEADAFYEAWAEELLQAAVEGLLDGYHSEGRGDYFRVFYGRVCEGMPVKEVAELLNLKVTDVDNFYRHARNRLETRLKELVRWHVTRYTANNVIEEEFHAEWQRLGEFLTQHGGLESALRRSYEAFSSSDLREREVESMTMIMKNVREYLSQRNGSK